MKANEFVRSGPDAVEPSPFGRIGFGGRNIGYAITAYWALGIEVSLWPPGIVLDIGHRQFWIQA